MSNLSNIEKMKLEKILETDGGYVLDFTNQKFGDFVYNATQKDIFSDKYALNGTSKAKRLRVFWDKEPNEVVGNLTKDLLEYWKTQKLLKQQSTNQHENSLYLSCVEIANRLSGKPQAKQMTEDDFIRTEFKNISLSRINLDATVTSTLEQRLSEIDKCLNAKAPLATIFLCGSTLEGILLGVASGKYKEFNTANASPKDKITRQTLPFQKWTLANFIDVSCELKLLGDDVRKFSHALRDFRNYIHPYQQLASKFDPDQHTAEICLKVLQAAISQLSK